MRSAGWRRLAGRAILGLPLLLLGCARPDAVGPERFVGRWQSSRSTAPIVLDANGEWKIVRADGSVPQYGVWQYRDSHLVWSFKDDSGIVHDANTVLAVTARHFELRERDGTVTTFDRLD